MITGIDKIDGKWSVWFKSGDQKFNLMSTSDYQNAEWMQEILDGVFRREQLQSEINALREYKEKRESFHGDITLL